MFLADGVLVTRPAAEGIGTADRLRGMGFRPVLAPLLAISPRPLRAPPHDAILLTSGNALPALAGLCAPVLAVGDSTAARARTAGFQQVESAGGNATDLVVLARRILRPGATLLLASGAGQGGGAAAALREAGFRVHRRIAYAARPVRRMPQPALDAIRAHSLRAALFLSAETAGTFVRLLPPPLAAELACIDAIAIGRPAADALALLPWRRVRVPLCPTLDQMLGLL